MTITEDLLVSVVLPTYNRSRFICESVESALNQTWRNIELIVVDDGSTDNTAEILSRYKNDIRLKYHYQDNMGQSAARNYGISLARGHYISFLDSDDVWIADKLEKQLEATVNNPEYDIYYGDIILIDEYGNEISRDNMTRYSGNVTGRLIGDNFISMSTTLTRRECFNRNGLFNESDRLAEDYELWLRFSVNCRFLYIPEYFCKYRVMNNQLSSNADKRLDCNEAIIRSFIQDNRHILSGNEIRRGLSHFYARRARYEAGHSKISNAAITLTRSLYYDPLWVGPWRVLARMLLGSRG